MRLALVTWVDAVQEQGEGTEAKAQPCTLQEVGWLMDENEQAILIGMENHMVAKGAVPGRFRLHIPRANIKELRVVEAGKAFPAKSVVWRS